MDCNKYDDLKQIINKIKKNIDKNNVKTTKKIIKNNILNILFEQLKIKSGIDSEILIKIIKNYLNQIEKPKYTDLFNNKYYDELLKLIKNKNNLNNFLINKKVIS